MAWALVAVLGLLVILNGLGLSIAPMLTALGVGGLAVALALQEPLANFFAGLFITLAGQIRVGDYVKLESGQEGYVVDFSWRSTRLRMLANNLILVPNAKLAQAIVVNHSLPSPDLAVLVEVGVDYASDLARVERVVVEVGREVMREVTGGVPEFEPFIRYHTFGDSSINFTVILRGGQFVDQYLIKHEFIKRLHARFDREGIVIPFPIRTLAYRTEADGQAARAGLRRRRLTMRHAARCAAVVVVVAGLCRPSAGQDASRRRRRSGTGKKPSPRRCTRATGPRWRGSSRQATSCEAHPTSIAPPGSATPCRSAGATTPTSTASTSVRWTARRWRPSS